MPVSMLVVDYSGIWSNVTGHTRHVEASQGECQQFPRRKTRVHRYHPHVSPLQPNRPLSPHRKVLLIPLSVDSTKGIKADHALAVLRLSSVSSLSSSTWACHRCRRPIFRLVHLIPLTTFWLHLVVSSTPFSLASHLLLPRLSEIAKIIPCMYV